MIRLLKEDPQVKSRERSDRCNEIVREISKTKTRKPEDVSKVLDVLIEVMPERITNLTIFNEGTKTIYRKFRENPCKEKFLKLCFYLGLFKKKHPGPTLLGDLMENYCDKMLEKGCNTTDFAIICTATYKASVRFASKKFVDRLVNEIAITKRMDNFIFVAFVKSLRLNKLYSPQVVEKLREFSNQGELENLDFKSLIHIFAYIADNSINDETLSNAFIDRCVNTMDKTARAKDMQMLLYSCALLNLSVNPDYIEKLNELAIARIDQEFDKKFDEFVDIALSMWMLGFKPSQLLKSILSDSRILAGGDASRVKIDSRKKLLLTCLEIEQPEWVRELNISPPSFDQQRPAPHYLVKPSLDALLKNSKSKKPKVVQQIKSLNIAGLLVEEDDGKLIHVEALDSTNVLSDRKSPNGIFALKLRLLRHIGCEVRVVSEGD